MGWDIDLVANGQPVRVTPHQTGSIQRAEMQGGQLVAIDSVEATCCITYNYGQLYRLADFDMKGMNGKKASETIDSLKSAVEKLGTRRDEDYWKGTPGNAGAALETLLQWAQEHPDAEWEIT